MANSDAGCRGPCSTDVCTSPAPPELVNAFLDAPP